MPSTPSVFPDGYNAHSDSGTSEPSRSDELICLEKNDTKEKTNVAGNTDSNESGTQSFASKGSEHVAGWHDDETIRQQRPPLDTPDARNDREADKSPARMELPEKSAAETVSSGEVELDISGRACRILYPDGKKERWLNRDFQGNVISISTRDENGQRTIFNKDGFWFIDVEGQRVPLPNEILVTNEGNFSTKISSDGWWRTELTDGTLLRERTNVTGCRLTFDNNQLSKISRRDGTTIQAIYKDAEVIQFVETTPQLPNPIRWQRHGDLWVSDQQPPQSRRSFTIEENGNTTWESLEGEKRVVRGSGIELQPSGGGSIHFDQQGRIIKIEYAGARRVRTFEYAENSAVLIGLVLEEAGKTPRVYRRSSNDVWLITDDTGRKLGSWRGYVQLADDGGYCVKALRGSIDESAGHWKIFLIDGSELREYRGDDGSRALFDGTGRLHVVYRADGSTIKAEYEDGKLCRITQSAGNVSRLWQKQGAVWTSDDGAQPDRRNPFFSQKGELFFFDDRQQQHVLRTSGLEEISKLDGSIVYADNFGRVQQTRANDDNRFFDYDATNCVTKITSVTRSGTTHDWQRRPGDDVTITRDGDIIIKSSDGTTAVERSTFQRLDYDISGRIQTLTNADGSRRQFQWQDDRLVAITDSDLTDGTGDGVTRPAPARSEKLWRLQGDTFVHTDSLGSEQVLPQADIENLPLRLGAP